ncbi:hypothetical protein AKJ37_00180 [candidate division MSBL1 archaeon SCGC-AAA259I09]|uniref:SpoVT-AbrB domain-containing protein n=3 Tax=candidate division MSBL1 TaxID=215777 RepID=A0A133UW27_9EURY|nr:hypothetical protein AKJ61_00400 [candidate division MSBL1 archaeon SCGC-AAA259B11]KXA95037.1 hypothetical protein AKJ36_01685 [candidate division MSBL1 archaeon SCGC-AAA259I07]KXA98413.1 hypothetical protein AKJ37_00180 [candidate division MSBL1 archaeon SCGC-AAA259I09]
MVNKRETRKIQTTGGSTYTVSLPKKWVDEIGLKSGDEMAIEEQSSSLLLSPADLKEKESTEAKIKVDAEEECDSIKRKILALYLVGYNVIKIRSADERLKSHHRSAIKELARKKLVGTEIISEEMEEITLQTLISHSQLSVKGALKRMFRVASSMQKNAVIALQENDRELAKDVIEIDDEVDRFQMYLIREVKAALQSPPLVEEIGLNTLRECLGYRLVSNSVERVGDHALSIAQNVLEMRDPVDKKGLGMLKEINSLSSSIFEKAVDSLFEENYQAAEEVIQKVEGVYELEKKVNKYLAEENPSEDIRIRLILESMRRIAEYGGDIAEIVLNLTIDNEQ